MLCAPDTLTSVDEALARLLGEAAPLEAEEIGLEAAFGRVLARAVVAPRSRPASDLSAMDGYAVRTADLERMRDGLAVVGVAYPGAPASRPVEPGEAVRITTGAPMPSGADRVVVDEAVAAAGSRVRLVRDPGGRPHVRPAGSDFAAGDVLVAAAARLGVGAVTAAAAAEAARLAVVRRPRVALIATGDEVAAPGDAGRRPHAIPDSVSYGVGALVAAWGGEVAGRLVRPDALGSLARLLGSLQGACDVVVVIGGASHSERDLARSAAVAGGARLMFAGVAMKPGKPVWAARSGEQVIVGLPGNPVAALVAARLFLAPLVAELGGRGAADALQWRPLPSAPALADAKDRDLFLLARHAGGRVIALPRQESSAQSALGSLTALIRGYRLGSNPAGAPTAAYIDF